MVNFFVKEDGYTDVCEPVFILMYQYIHIVISY